jgi:hypothetical protein
MQIHSERARANALRFPRRIIFDSHLLCSLVLDQKYKFARRKCALTICKTLPDLKPCIALVFANCFQWQSVDTNLACFNLCLIIRALQRLCLDCSIMLYQIRKTDLDVDLHRRVFSRITRCVVFRTEHQAKTLLLRMREEHQLVAFEL